MHVIQLRLKTVTQGMTTAALLCKHEHCKPWYELLIMIQHEVKQGAQGLPCHT